ncbi:MULTISPECIES: MotE family protein [Gracilibacillus]|uniref:hypothetical protein n=1 Tax=Gracilibacillus TaxID=74385 RepID=UPI000826A566|nr:MULTISPECIES: hypothetical protein [Gracilibacillus]
MAKNSSKQKEKKAGMFQWLMVIVVPLIFAAIITVIILSVMGVDVMKHTKETLNKVPFLSEYVTTDDEAYYQHQLTNRDQSIEQLQARVEELEVELETSQGTVTDLEEELAEASVESVELGNSEETPEEEDDNLEELSESFLAMKPEEAAPIIENLADEVAIPLLTLMDAEARGEIMAVMESEVAANYASMLAAE